MERPTSPEPPDRPWPAPGPWSAPDASRPGPDPWSPPAGTPPPGPTTEPDRSTATGRPADHEETPPGYIPPDPDEPPPFELWPAVGHIVPWGTWTVLLCWASLHALVALRGEVHDAAALLLWGASATGLPPADAAWRLLASTFLHGGFGHVLFNSLTLLVLGPAVERVFARPAFWIAYAGGGAAASLASLLWREARSGGILSLSVGGSGAIFALAGVLLAGAARLRGRLAAGRARALGGALLFVVTQSLAGGATRVGTDNIAHLAGLLAGVLVGTVVPLGEPLSGRPAGRFVRALALASAAALAVALGLSLRTGLRLG